MTRIPIIDLAQCPDISSPSARQAAVALFDALSQTGFAYIAGHNVPRAARDAAFSASRAFHASSLEQKQSLAINAFHRGYLGMSQSTLIKSSVAKVTKPNMSESLMIMHTLAEDDPGLLAGLPMQGPNQWPDWLPTFEPAMRAYEAEVEQLARYLIELIALGLNLPSDALNPYFERPTTFLRALHYPPQPPQEQDAVGSAPHTDYGIITLLAQDNSGGLQVKPIGQEWIDAPPIEDTYVLNVGDMLSRWSNGRLRSTPHRVINRSGGDRYSLPYFFDPAMEVLIEALPTCVDAEHPAKYEPVRYGDYLLDRLNTQYNYRNKALEAASAQA